MLRYNDNFSYLKSDSAAQKGFNTLKYIPLLGIGTVSFGNELREQLQYYHNFNFGDMPPVTNEKGVWQLWHRTMAHGNIEVGRNINFFVQLGSTFRFFNPYPAVPEIDENHLSLHQLFGEFRFSDKWKVRAGRQELSYGSHRLFTFREGPNTRLAFDAAIIKHNATNRKFDLFAMSPVISRKGVFDDEALKDVIVGFYATEQLMPKVLLLDYYVLSFQSQRRKYNFVTGNDQRQIGGVRAYSQAQTLNVEFEFNYQWGYFNEQSVRAYGAFVDLNYRLPVKNSAILGITGNYVSGDQNSEDNQLNTYNSLFAKPQYGLTAPIGATNTVAINPYVKLAPATKTNVYAGAYFLWRQSGRDGIYTPGGIEIRPGVGKTLTIHDNEIGTLLALETSYSFSRNMSIAFDASHFFAGNYIQRTGRGEDIDYVSVKIGYKF